mmetsp:Transcript_16903/g.25573  ORF Transcript_16903/g.25573 Transcript_16903/m.25573 type:complete len:110 (+) Transcript_16903:148-477(+)
MPFPPHMMIQNGLRALSSPMEKTPSRVKFDEEVTIILIVRKTPEEAKDLFWSAKDYKRMRRASRPFLSLISRIMSFLFEPQYLVSQAYPRGNRYNLPSPKDLSRTLVAL